MLNVYAGFTFTPWRILAAAFLVLSPAALFAQSGETDVGEVSVYTGGSFGAGTHPFVGGSSGFAFSRHGMAFLEGSYTAMGHDILWPRHDVQSPRDSKLFDVMFAAHIRFPVRERWAPYGIIGGGMAFDLYRAYAGPNGALIGIEDFKVAFQTGGGVRYYVRDSWGIRSEFKVIVSSRTFTRAAVGVFYVLPPNWP
jgi:opacity protein-like surface antigen